MLQRSVNQLKGVGPALQEKLAQRGIFNLQDLLFHLPLRYQDRTRVASICQLQTGQDVVLEGRIQDTHVQFGKRRSLLCTLNDDSGLIQLRFFHFSAAQRSNLEQASAVRCYGEVRRGPRGLELVHPEIEYAIGGQFKPLSQTLTAVYPSGEGMHQATWRKLIDQALIALQNARVDDLLPSQCMPFDITLEAALQFLHHPPVGISTEILAAGRHPAMQRLCLEELCAHQLSMLAQRQANRAHRARAIDTQHPQQDNLLSCLPFALTTAQQRVLEEINRDLACGHPMHRLLQGDVGSGKTVIAALAAVQVVGDSGQVAVMAPTEILAEQHLLAFREWLEPLNIRVGWLTGRSRATQRRETLEALQCGEIDVLVGTHALFQEAVEFNNLYLAIIDEQHRFGVHQRLALREKGKDYWPHQLVMTATPIPRTLAMSTYADLDVSVIDELPPGRTPVNTVLIENTRREQIVDRILAACQEGKQVYWVCTLIEESETLQCEAAEDTWQRLSEELQDCSVGLVHGRMKADEKSTVMEGFKSGAVDVLVATTVIEVGVNVPNASLMVIENPERLGLAQLHQLRGRVGRGSTASHCVLLYQKPLSKTGRERLQIMRETNDGFIIAEKDLQLRGPGEFLGTRQTGLAQLKVADLERDQHLFDVAQRCASTIQQDHPDIAALLVKRWLYGAEKYANA